MTNPRLRPPEHRVAPRAVLMWTLSGLAGTAVVTALLAGAAVLIRLGGWAWLPGPVVEYAWWPAACYAVYGAVRSLVAPRWRYRVHRWEVTDDVVYTRAGWISRAWQLVPVSRIQTVDHTQGWLERMFGLATVEVRTASHAGSSTIEGLRADVARELSERLAVRAGELRDDAT
ncbi:PH domain-containing protein [Marinactinospora rubrisoli]|uniref:PH domain-containing protein n=1 Tax=Marinactinospora rubrisoli TaxID=2715399 RepID=A0ABW2KDU8_9ACTN